MPHEYIEECLINRHRVKIITINGFHMYCTILEEFTDHIIVLCDTAKKLVYKHAISTIEPAEK